MNSLPNELIALISEHLDVMSAVRFSRTCKYAHENTLTNHDVMIARMKLICDEIATVGYQIYKRSEHARGDGYCDYCSVRTYRDRVVGALHRTAYDNGANEHIEDTIFFSDNIKMNGFEKDLTDDLYVVRRFASDDETRVQVETYGFKPAGTLQPLNAESAIDINYHAIYESISDICGYVGIYAMSPTIVDGELRWKDTD